jgi:SAM-dependent methyltransferase
MYYDLLSTELTRFACLSSQSPRQTHQDVEEWTVADWLSNTRSSYDTDAAGYAAEVRGLLDERPYLRASLTLFADLVNEGERGPVADVGCGPGYVAAYLHDIGVDAFGIDLSPEMVAVARRDHPEVSFEVGTMTNLDLADGSLAGIIAFWSVIHVPDDAVPGVFEEFGRVLRPGAPVLIGFHVGDETRHTDKGYTGRRINLDSHRRRPSTVARWLREAAFTMEAELVMRPDEEVPGAILFARAST